MKLRLATLCTVLTASASFAQTTATLPRLAILRPDDPNIATYTFGAAQCNDTITLTWSNTLIINLLQCVQNPLKLWSTAGECQDTPGATDTRYDDIPSLTLNTVRQGSFRVKIAELPDFKTTSITDGGTLLPCGDPTPFTKTHHVCGSVEYAVSSGLGCGTVTRVSATPLKLVYDTQPPPTPVITEQAAQDKGVRVKFTTGGDTATVLLEVKGPADSDFRQVAEVPVANAEAKATGLENGVDYAVRVRAKDAAGNISDPSNEVTITPIHTLGFWGFYKEAGGTDQGGCSVGAGLMPLLFAAFAFRRARKQVRRPS